MDPCLFLQDCVAIAAEALRAGRIDRRGFLKACAAAGAAPAFAAAAGAQDKPARIVHANWGGAAAACTETIYGAPFTKETGVAVAVDGSGPIEGRIRQMVEAKHVAWDCCDADFFNSLRLGPRGLLEAIDYNIVDKNKVFPEYAGEYGICSYFYSYVLTYDTAKVGSTPPRTWADFWDIRKYPGKRALYRWMNGALEAALMADGVPRDKVYPIDIGRALDKIREIKDHLLFWSSGEESQRMFTQGEVVMGELWHTRSALLERDTKGRVSFTWNQGTVAAGAWITPTGNPAGREWAMRWIAWMQDPNLQIAMMKCAGQGPANPAAAALMTPDLQRIHPALPDNWKLQLPMDQQWFAEHYDEALNSYLDVISS